MDKILKVIDKHINEMDKVFEIVDNYIVEYPNIWQLQELKKEIIKNINKKEG